MPLTGVDTAFKAACLCEMQFLSANHPHQGQVNGGVMTVMTHSVDAGK